MLSENFKTLLGGILKFPTFKTNSGVLEILKQKELEALSNRESYDNAEKSNSNPTSIEMDTTPNISSLFQSKEKVLPNFCSSKKQLASNIQESEDTFKTKISKKDDADMEWDDCDERINISAQSEASTTTSQLKNEIKLQNDNESLKLSSENTQCEILNNTLISSKLKIYQNYI